MTLIGHQRNRVFKESDQVQQKLTVKPVNFCEVDFPQVTLMHDNVDKLWSMSRKRATDYEAISDEDTNIPRYLGIPYIAFSFTLESRFVKLIFFLEHSLQRFQCM